MARIEVEYKIYRGPSKLDLMLSLFDTELGQRTVKFHAGHTTYLEHMREYSTFSDWYPVQIVSARRCNPIATIWELEGIAEVWSKDTRVSIRYLSDTREGQMKFHHDEPQTPTG